MKKENFNEIKLIKFKLLYRSNNNYNYFKKIVNFKMNYINNILSYLIYLFTDVNRYKNYFQYFFLKKRVSCENYLESFGNLLNDDNERYNLIRFSKLDNFCSFEDYLLIENLIKKEEVANILENERKLENKRIKQLCSEICNNDKITSSNIVKNNKRCSNKKSDSSNYCSNTENRIDNVLNY